MNWFQRYGIPGAYFEAMVLLWTLAYYNCAIGDILDKDVLTAVGALVVALFLPLGYLLSMLGQLFYHLVPGLGIDTRARQGCLLRGKFWKRRARTAEFGEGCRQEWKQEVFTMSEIIRSSRNDSGHLEVVKFVLEWMSKRMDMIVINGSIILGTVISCFCGKHLPGFLFSIEKQPDADCRHFACLLSLIVLLLALLSWCILTMQLVRVEKRLFAEWD